MEALATEAAIGPPPAFCHSAGTAALNPVLLSEAAVPPESGKPSISPKGTFPEGLSRERASAGGTWGKGRDAAKERVNFCRRAPFSLGAAPKYAKPSELTAKACDSKGFTASAKPKASTGRREAGSKRLLYVSSQSPCDTEYAQKAMKKQRFVPGIFPFLRILHTSVRSAGP